MSKTNDTFLSMMKSNTPAEFGQEAPKPKPESQPKARAEMQAVAPRSSSVAEPERRQIGRPSSFEPGEPAIRRNYRISEIDDQALKIYLGTTDERDLSQVVRNAIRAYIPDEIYRTAEVMVNLKHSAIG